MNCFDCIDCTKCINCIRDKQKQDKIQLIESLKSIGAIQFGNFILKSGQTSAYYFDLRKIYSYPNLLEDVVKRIASLVKSEEFLNLKRVHMI